MKNGETGRNSFTHFFIEILKELKSILEEKKIDFAILGGLAAGAWGRSRATDDIDLVIHVSLEDLESLVQKFKTNGYIIRILGAQNPPDLIELIKKKGDITIRVDIMLANIDYQKKALKRKVWLKIFDTEIPVISPEDLLF